MSKYIPLPREIWAEVINLYKSMPFLWNKKDPKYSSKGSRESGYKIILKKYKEFDKNATLPGIKRKIDNMRTSYRRELKKVLASKRNRSDSEDIYVPELWYFDSLKFLNEHIMLYNYRHWSDEDDNETEQTSESQLCIDVSYKSEETPVEEYLSIDNIKVKTRKRKRQRIKHNVKDESPQPTTSGQEDDWLLVGKSIGIQLRSLDDDQVVLAQRLISDAISYAKLGRLTEESFISLTESNDDDYLEE